MALDGKRRGVQDRLASLSKLKLIIAMENPTIQTDIAEILREIKADQRKVLEEINSLKLNVVKVEGKIDTLDTKTEQLNTRIGNVEFAVRGVLIGLAVIVLGGFAMFFWMSSKL